jgi:hypothetical protein
MLFGVGVGCGDHIRSLSTLWHQRLSCRFLFGMSLTHADLTLSSWVCCWHLPISRCGYKSALVVRSSKNRKVRGRSEIRIFSLPNVRFCLGLVIHLYVVTSDFFVKTCSGYLRRLLTAFLLQVDFIRVGTLKLVVALELLGLLLGHDVLARMILICDLVDIFCRSSRTIVT